jgi:peptidoglycan/LPS O-acetylase OafA/YrhL
LPQVWIRLSGWIGAALLIFSLGFSMRAYAWGLGRNGLNMTVLAIGTALVITAASQSGWSAPRFLSPLLSLGRHSYEIYLTHMFTVMGLFAIFVHAGKPMWTVPLLFVAVIAVAGVIGWAVATGYTEPMNRLIRKRTAVVVESLKA